MNGRCSRAASVLCVSCGRGSLVVQPARGIGAGIGVFVSHSGVFDRFVHARVYIFRVGLLGKESCL